MIKIAPPGRRVNSTLDLALDFITFHPTRYIAPVRTGAKFPPLIHDPLNKASNDFDQIRRWHDRWPECNWLLAHAKSRAIVADVDCKPGKNGAATYELLELLYGWPPTETTQTPSGGLHHLYSGRHVFSLARKSAAGVYLGGGFGEDVDSPHYTIIAGCTLADGGTYTALGGVAAPAPAWFAEVLKPVIPNATVEQQFVIESDQQHHIDRYKEYLEDAPQAVENSAGHMTALQVVAVGKDMGLTPGTIYDCLHEWNERNDPPFVDDDDTTSQNSLWVRVQNAFKYLRQNAPGSRTAEADFASSTVPPLTDDEKRPVSPARIVRRYPRRKPTTRGT